MGKRGHVHWDRSLERIKGFSTKALLAGPFLQAVHSAAWGPSAMGRQSFGLATPPVKKHPKDKGAQRMVPTV